MNKDLSFYQGKKVLVTGHTGFKGGWLCHWLERLGANVVGFGLAPNTEPSLYETSGVENVAESVFGDISDLNAVKEVASNSKPDVIFHLAAQPLVRLSYADPVSTFETNVMGTVNILEAARTLPNLKACLVITSDKCYQNNEWDYSYRENDPMGGFDPYSASKGAAEIVVGSYRASFFKEPLRGLGSARAGNVIGGGDWAENRIVPDAIRSLSKGQEVHVRNPLAIRPWQHVLDPLYGYLLLGERLAQEPEKFSSGWNFGPLRSDINVSRLVQMIVDGWGTGKWVQDEVKGPHEAHFLRLDSTKAQNNLGWYPHLDIDLAVKMTVDWYKAYLDKRDMRQMTEDQIHQFMDILRTGANK
ncbi:MAG: CDP-glucose 4,6-dehydratase [Methanomassiliicoccales archaeon]